MAQNFASAAHACAPDKRERIWCFSRQNKTTQEGRRATPTEIHAHLRRLGNAERGEGAVSKINGIFEAIWGLHAVFLYNGQLIRDTVFVWAN